MFKSGKFVAKHLQPHDGGELDDKQIQPNGVDLTIDKIMTHGQWDRKYDAKAVMGDETYKKPEREEAETLLTEGLSDDVTQHIDSDFVYVLEPGGYIVVYDEEILEIPKDHVGFVWPRSRFLRTSSHLTSAVWDTGYSGRGEGALITTVPMFVDPNMRVGQMTFARADNHGYYEGQHQGERIDE